MDMTTLFSALAMTCVVTAAFTWFLHTHHRDVVGTFAIACSNSCFALGFGMIALRAHLSGFLSFIVANGLISVGVESRKCAVAWAVRHHSVSLPRSSNRTCRFPASGFPTGFFLTHTTAHLFAGLARKFRVRQRCYPMKTDDTPALATCAGAS